MFRSRGRGRQRVTGEGVWPATVAEAVRLADQLAQVRSEGASAEASCGQAVDLMAGLGIRSLTARGNAARGAFEDANASLTATAHLWEVAVTAALAVDPDGAAGVADAAGGVLLPGMVGDRLRVSERSGAAGAGAGHEAAGAMGPRSGRETDEDTAVGRLVVPFGWESVGQKMVEGLPGTTAPVEGQGREWGLTAVDLYRDRHGAGAVLVHYDRDSTVGYDPVNDPYWGRLVGPDGELLEGRVLPSLRDELGRPEGLYVPTRAERSRARAAEFATGTVEQVATGWAPGVLGTAVGQVLGPAKESATRRLAGRANDPTAPRRLVFSQRFDQMNMTQLELVRADFPRRAREDARHAQYVELERQAHRLGVGEQALDRARTAIARLPAFPRSSKDRYEAKYCLQAVQMHHREGRMLLAMDLLSSNRSNKR